MCTAYHAAFLQIFSEALFTYLLRRNTSLRQVRRSLRAAVRHEPRGQVAPARGRSGIERRGRGAGAGGARPAGRAAGNLT